MDKTVLITGGLGFIGKKIARYFKQHHYYVIGIGHGNIEKEINAEEIVFDEWYQDSLTIINLKKISKKADLIVHCAGGSTVGISIDNPYLDYHKTVNSTLELLEFMRLYSSSSLLIYLSSAAVYGSKPDEPIKEIDLKSPVSPYGFHKLASEDICRSYALCFNIRVSIVRLFSIYGEDLHKQLLWEACSKMISATDKVVFFGTGDETRDWLHVNDVASLVMQLSAAGTDFGIFNGAFGHRITVREVLYKLRDELGRNELEIEFNQHYKEGDPKYYWADIKQASNTGWNPEILFNAGLGKYVKWFKSTL